MTEFYLYNKTFDATLNGTVSYLYHVTKPRFFGYILHVDSSSNCFSLNERGLNTGFIYQLPGAGEELFYIVVSEDIDHAGNQLAGPLSKAAKYFIQRLNAIRKRAGRLVLLQDYHANVKGVKIAHALPGNYYILNIFDAIRTFKERNDLFGFLRWNHLQEKLFEGKLNVVTQCCEELKIPASEQRFGHWKKLFFFTKKNMLHKLS